MATPTWSTRPRSAEDGSRILTGIGDKAKIWDAKTGVLVLTVNVNAGPLSSASFSTDGSRVITTTYDGSPAKVWKRGPAAEVCTLKGHAEGVQSGSFNPTGHGS